MRDWQVLACVVDADPNINDARRFARKFRGYVWLTRYRRGQTAKEIAIQEEEEVLRVRATHGPVYDKRMNAGNLGPRGAALGRAEGDR